jgi:nucleotide-binding universal stress UspA family protein
MAEPRRRRDRRLAALRSTVEEEQMMNEQQTMPTVLVGVDGSDDALRAVRWAAAEADRRQLPLRLVLAFTWVAEPDFEMRTGDEPYRNMLLEQARARLAQAASTAAEQGPGLAVQQQLIVGYPAEVLAAEARRARLLVLGDRGLSRIEGVLVGSTAAAMAAHAACPIVVVRGTEMDQEASRTRPVVVGIDDSSSSESAIGFAFEAAAARNVPLLAMHAYADPFAGPRIRNLINWDVIADEETRRLNARLERWVEKFPDVAVRPVPAHDRAVHQLIALSETAQLVVVGSRGHGQLTGLLLGSVSNALMHKAACPVAVVRPDTADR